MTVDPRFAPHNTHREDPSRFATLDPQLRELRRVPIAYRYPMLAKLPVEEPGIYSITGGRRVGKSTVLKQWMADLLDRGVSPERILYLTGELIDDHHALVALLTRTGLGRSDPRPAYLLVDEVTWNALARDLSIDHPATVANYLGLLARMDVLVVQHALREDRLAAAPKKARKVAFSDPFILHAVRSWLDPVADPFTSQVKPALADPEWAGKMAEACVAAHHHRLHPTFYIKGNGEVDVAFVAGEGFQPVEVKWTAQIRSADLKQARRYPNSIVCSKLAVARVHGLPNELLPHHLQRLGPSPHYVTW